MHCHGLVSYLIHLSWINNLLKHIGIETLKLDSDHDLLLTIVKMVTIAECVIILVIGNHLQLPNICLTVSITQP